MIAFHSEIRVLHLTHTSIFHDNRICKIIEAISNIPNTVVYGQGLYLASRDCHSPEDSCSYSFADHIQTLYFRDLKAKKLLGSLSGLIIIALLYYKCLMLIIRKSPNIVHVHDFPCLIPALLLKPFFRFLIVYDAHELESMKNGSTILYKYLVQFLEKISWPYVHHLITVSESIALWYLRKYGAKTYTIILNSPHRSQSRSITYSRKSLLSKFNIPETSLVYMYVGALEPGRGLHEIIDVFSENHSDSHLIVVGHGSMFNEIQRVSSGSSNVHTMGYVPFDKVLELISSVDYGLCLIKPISLSDTYCLPNKLFEYAFAGVTIIATDLPEISKVVNSYKLGKLVRSNHLQEDLRSLVIENFKADNKVDLSTLRELSWEFQSLKLCELYKTLYSIFQFKL